MAQKNYYSCDSLCTFEWTINLYNINVADSAESLNHYIYIERESKSWLYRNEPLLPSPPVMPPQTKITEYYLGREVAGDNQFTRESKEEGEKEISTQVAGVWNTALGGGNISDLLCESSRTLSFHTNEPLHLIWNVYTFRCRSGNSLELIWSWSLLLCMHSLIS